MTSLFLTVLNMSITAIFVILAVLVLRLLFKRLPRVYSYLLWIVVMLRLVCPFALEADFGVIPSVQVGAKTGTETRQESMSNSTEKQFQTLPAESVSVGEHTEYDLSGEKIRNSIPDAWYTEVDKKLNFDGELHIGQGISDAVWKILSVIWLTGMLSFIGYGIWSYRKLLLKLQKIPEQPKRIAGQEGYRVVASEYIGTPFTAGFLKPTIYLPAGLATNHEEMVIEHEKMHIRRRDYLIKAAAYMMTCLHWFNPFVWLSFYLLEADMEASCDEAVLRRIGYDRKKNYANALLSLGADHTMEIGRCPLAFGENNVKERIKNAIGLKKIKTWVAIVSAILVVGVIALLSVNHTGKNNTENDADIMQEQIEENIVEGDGELISQQAAEDNVIKNIQEPAAPDTSLQDAPDQDRNSITEVPQATDAADTQLEISSGETDDPAAVLLRNPEGNYVDVQILYGYPVADSTFITTYGTRVHPVDGTVRVHSGIDFRADSGSDIYAAADGTVFETGYDTNCGNYIILSHSNGDMTYYMHCSELLAEVGQKVTRGEIIAKVGSTGMSTGAHLHFAVSHDGGYIEPVFEMSKEEQMLLQMTEEVNDLELQLQYDQN